jgi:cysteine synthase A
MGCARYFEWHRRVRVVAVDCGLGNFGGPPGRRTGPRHSVRPPVLDESYVDGSSASRRRTPFVPAIGWQPLFLFGGSTGTVVSGALDWFSQHGAYDLTAVAIARASVSGISARSTRPTG